MTTSISSRPVGCLCPWEEEDPACPVHLRRRAALAALEVAGYADVAEEIRHSPTDDNIRRAAEEVRLATPQSESARAWHVAAIRAINAVAEAYGVSLGEPDDRPTQANEPLTWQAARELPMYHAGPYDQRCRLGVDGGRCVRIWDHAGKGLPCLGRQETKAGDGVPDPPGLPRTQQEILHFLEGMISKQYDREETVVHAVEEYRDAVIAALLAERKRMHAEVQDKGDRLSSFGLGEAYMLELISRVLRGGDPAADTAFHVGRVP